MDFLKDIALSQSHEHVRLLLFMMNLVFILLLPYLGFLLISSVLSYRADREGRRANGDAVRRYGRHLIDLPMASKGVVTFLAILPAFALVFLLAELLQGSPAIAAGLMGFGFLALLAGAACLYGYKFTYKLGGILAGYSQLLKEEKEGRRDPAEDIPSYLDRNEHTHFSLGRYGIALLVVASGLVTAAITVTGDPASWDDVQTIFDVLLSAGFWFRYLQFLAIGIGATGAAILFFSFSWHREVHTLSDDVAALARRDGIRLSIVSMLLQPLAIVGTLATAPRPGLNGSAFALSAIALLLFFLSAHFIYAYRKEPRSGYAAYAFYAVALAVILLVTRDQLAISSATREHSVRLVAEYTKELETLKTKYGVALSKALTGQDIYDAKCSACHLFDVRKVGPAYKDVVPKYFGKKAELLAFIMSPTKVDPAFPSMPNQGLRPADADSIASFLLAKFAPAATTPQAATK
jgi:cytochrome c